MLKNSIKNFISEWTEKAQTKPMTDEERAVYYECAEQLHNLA